MFEAHDSEGQGHVEWQLFPNPHLRSGSFQILGERCQGAGSTAGVGG
jgi:hypothetical protein